VLSVAEVAGIQAAKNTWALIPLCHNIPLDHVLVNCILCENGIQVTSEVRSTGKTGVEMEALTAVSVALLTVYDMCKAVDKHMKISEITLFEKTKTPITV
jgi:cyclic pyranopterin phosphate synthase